MILFDYSKSKIIDFDSFIDKAKDYDVIHIQNEFGLFNGPFGLDFSMKVFYRILCKLKKLNKSFHNISLRTIFLKISRTFKL